MKTKTRRSFGRGAIYVAVLALSVSYLLPSRAFAFSGYGAGTSDNPYRIGNCSQLEEINNDLSASYILVSNIDCSGISNFSELASNSSAFTGTLDGQDHTIKDLNMSPSTPGNGLFNQTNGATIEKS